MKYIKRYNESLSENDVTDFEDFVEASLVDLLDKGYQFNTIKLPESGFKRIKNQNGRIFFYIGKIEPVANLGGETFYTNDDLFTYEDINHNFVSFLEKLDSEYNLGYITIVGYDLSITNHESETWEMNAKYFLQGKYDSTLENIYIKYISIEIVSVKK